jgi:branched-chain amino acid transport system permease protein
VIGGAGSLLGAVVGALAVSGVNYYLVSAETGGWLQHHPGTHLVVLGVFMTLVLVARPTGLTGGRELTLPRLRSDRVQP